MPSFTRSSAALAGVAALTLTACGTETGSRSENDQVSVSSRSLAATSALDRHDQDDVYFASHMIVALRGHIGVARLVERSGSRADLREFASTIEAGRLSAIWTMSDWLRIWGEQVPEGGWRSSSRTAATVTPRATPTSGTGASAADGEHAPDLPFPRGPELDTAILEGLIVHLDGPVQLARWEQDFGTNPVVIAMAKKIEAEQSEEIAQVRRMLEAD